MRLHTLRSLAFSAAFLVVACKSSPSTSTAVSTNAVPQGEAKALPGLAFLEGFEGEIHGEFSRAKPGETPSAIGAVIKTGKFRFDIPQKLTDSRDAQRFFGAKAWGIFDSVAKKLSIVSDEKKQVIVIDMNQIGERFKNLGAHRAPAPGIKPEPEKPASKIAKTGKYETVAGRQCEDWELTSDHRQATICVAHEGISWFSLPAATLPGEQAWALEMLDGKHFPMKFVGYDKDGTTEDARFEITMMEKRSIADSSFQYPPDYSVMDLDQFIQSMVAGTRKEVAGGADTAAVAGGPPGAGGSHPAMPPGMPANIPGLTPDQMQQIRQRIQQAQQRQ